LQEKRVSHSRNSSDENKMMSAFAGSAGSNSGIVLAGWALTVPVIVSRRASDSPSILPRPVAALEGLQE
jgi:hypothetical protein